MRILEVCRREDFVPKIPAEVLRCSQVDPKHSKYFGKRKLYATHADQTDDGYRLKLNHYIDVTFGTKVVA